MTKVLHSLESMPLRELALLYLRLGTTAFGGPAAHVAMMEDEVVRRRPSREEERLSIGALKEVREEIV